MEDSALPEAGLPLGVPLIVRCLCDINDEHNAPQDAMVFDAPDIESRLADFSGVVLSAGSETRAEVLLAAGAACVFLGEAALLDSLVVDRLVARHGTERIGIYAPLRRQAVSWSFDTVSNADFRVVTPSFCEPAWEVLRADGSGTGTLAAWWLKAMRQLGAGSLLVRADITDDTELNLCATLVEEFGAALWLGPMKDETPPLVDWVRYGQLRQLALPPELYARRENLLAAFAPATDINPVAIA